MYSLKLLPCGLLFIKAHIPAGLTCQALPIMKEMQRGRPRTLVCAKDQRLLEVACGDGCKHPFLCHGLDLEEFVS